MNRYRLDANAMGDLMNRRHDVHVQAAEARKRGAVIGTCEPVVAELFAGIENSGQPGSVHFSAAPGRRKMN
jgi:hypothetical protein